jgi:hypothetical protein
MLAHQLGKVQGKQPVFHVMSKVLWAKAHGAEWEPSLCLCVLHSLASHSRRFLAPYNVLLRGPLVVAQMPAGPLLAAHLRKSQSPL